MKSLFEVRSMAPLLVRNSKFLVLSLKICFLTSDLKLGLVFSPLVSRPDGNKSESEIDVTQNGETMVPTLVTQVEGQGQSLDLGIEQHGVLTH